jgi:protein-disulfide isomerase
MCRQWAVEVEPQLDEKYFKTGQVKFTYQYYPLTDPNESYWAAEAAECANEQGRFWEYHNRLISEWRGESSGAFTKARLKMYAANLKFDSDAFGLCLDTDRTRPIVQAARAQGRQLGVTTTPSFFLNGKRASGDISQASDSLLKSLEGTPTLARP